MYCKKCGSEIDDSASFCQKCGQPTSDNNSNVQVSTSGSAGKITAAKVFIILSMVAMGLAVVYLAIALCMSASIGDSSEVDGMQITAGVIVTVMLVFLVLAAVIFAVGIWALKKLKTSTKSSQLTACAILTLLFCNLIAGIIMLVITDEDLAAYQQQLKNN